MKETKKVKRAKSLAKEQERLQKEKEKKELHLHVNDVHSCDLCNPLLSHEKSFLLGKLVKKYR